MNVPLLFYEGTGRAPERLGLAHPSICPYGAFATEDGALVLISIQNEREWAEFCAKFLDEPDLPQREGYQTNVIRVANRATVDAHVAAAFARLSRAQAAERLRGANTAYGFVNDVAVPVASSGVAPFSGGHAERSGVARRAAGAVQRRAARPGPGACDRRALRRDPRRIRRLTSAADPACAAAERRGRWASPGRCPARGRVGSRRRPSAA